MSIAPAPVPAMEGNRGKILLAAFLSPILPGLGHLLSKRYGKGCFLLAIFCSLVGCFWPLRLLGHNAALIALVAAMIALCIFATYDAGYGGRGRADKLSPWWLTALLPFAFLAAAIHLNWNARAAGFQTFDVPSRSMENTVMLGDSIFVDRRYYQKHTPVDGEVAILVNPEGLFAIKRIIASGGETIEGRDGVIFVNGKQLTEPYVVHSGSAPPEMNHFGPLTVPAGKLFVMGDNRDVSLDSRSRDVGPLSVTSLRGKPLYTITSPKLHSFKPIK